MSLPRRDAGGFTVVLYEDILALAAASGDVCGVRLAVARGNTRAKATYEALGMGRSVYDLYEVDFAHGKNSSRAGLDKATGCAHE